jgi:hypothetical protein
MIVSGINRAGQDTAYFTPDDRLVMATKAWLIWLQGLFGSRPVGHYRWDRNISETEIVISDQMPTNIEPTNKRPIITTSRGPASWASMSINQVRDLDLSGQRKVYSDLLSCSMTISVIAREGLEAQGLAYMLFRMVPVFKPQLLRLGRMHAIGNNAQLTPETPHGALVPGSSVPEWKMVQLVVPMYIQDTISSEDEGFHTMLRAVTLEMELLAGAQLLAL